MAIITEIVNSKKDLNLVGSPEWQKETHRIANILKRGLENMMECDVSEQSQAVRA